MRVQSRNGDLIWAPSEFGSGDVDKIGEIAEILKSVFKDMTVHTVPTEVDISSYNVYSKPEVDRLLEAYVKLTALQTAVEDKINTLIMQGVILSPNTAEMASFNTRIREVELLVSNSNNRVDSLNTAVSSISGSVGKMNLLNTNARTTIVESINEVDANTNTNASNIATNKANISANSTAITQINNAIKNMANTTDIAALQSAVGALTTQITDLAARVSAIENA